MMVPMTIALAWPMPSSRTSPGESGLKDDDIQLRAVMKTIDWNYKR
jgi:hypothetical protein